jgi:hypothetical protein
MLESTARHLSGVHSETIMLPSKESEYDQSRRSESEIETKRAVREGVVVVVVVCEVRGLLNTRPNAARERGNFGPADDTWR